MVIARPRNMLAKMSHGLADELVSSLAWRQRRVPILIAPAMTPACGTPTHAGQYETPPLLGVHVVGPGEVLACRTTGAADGRTAEIFDRISKLLTEGPPKRAGSNNWLIVNRLIGESVRVG